MKAQSSRIWFFKFRVENMANLAKSQLSTPTVLASSGLQICIYKCGRLFFPFFQAAFYYVAQTGLKLPLF